MKRNPIGENGMSDLETTNVSVSSLFLMKNSVWKLYMLRLFRSFMRFTDRYEIIFVNDGSSDESQSVLEKIAASDRETRTHVVQLKKNCGKGNSSFCWILACERDIIITMDADLQDDPKGNTAIP